MKIQIRKTLSEDMKAPYYKRVKSIHEKNKKILIGFGVGANENRGPFKTDKSMGKKGESAPPGAAGGGSLEETVISEGGNVFKDKEGNISTKRISRSDVKPTVKWLEGITGLSLLDNLLGTGGIAETSGDLDLAVNDAETTKAELESKLKQSFPAQYVVKTGNSVHFKTPILGDESNGFVQTDFMFGDPTWLKFAMRGGKPGSVYKGFHKHLLLASIAKAQGYKWSYLNGLVDRATNKIISKDADQIAKTILGQGKTEKDMYDVESVIDAIKDRPDYEELVQQARGDFEREGVKFPETKTPEKLTEAKEGPRIQHAEDVVFWEGSKGANRVLDLLSSLASDKGKSSTTIKWDGSPAIIFGRDENGQFIFTDKSGFTAKGYDGKAKSPKQLKDILINTRRVSKGLSVDQGYQDFANKMADAFTIFEKALPQSYRGYFFGDLLYLNTPSIVDGKYQFKPNIVTYKVDPKSEIGKRIGKSKAGVVVHREIDFEDNKTPVQNYNIFQGSDLLVVPPVTVQAPVKIDTKSIASLKSKVNSNASKIDDLLDEQKLRSMKLTAFPDLLYAYLNSKVDTGLTDLGKDFIQWLNSKQSITATAKENVKKYISENSESFDILWQIVDGVMNVKNNIIHQLDAQDAPIKSSIGDVGVGEGYVMADPRGDIKLVDRTVFSKANRSIVRENQEPKQPANTVVLFAGSFKPPHKGHIGLINEVSHLPGVEKIVVLISDPVQETSIRTKDFGAKEVKLIFEIYARAFDFGCSVDFEVSNAPSSMSAAYKYLETERFQPNTKVLFATSKADSGRYPQAKLDKSALKNASNPTAGSIELPEMIDPDTSKKFSATNMREILADPNSDKQLLKKYMPENLPEKDKQLVIDMLTKSSRHEQADKMMNEILSELLNLIVEKKEMICDGSQCETTHKGMSHDEYSIFQEKKDRCYQIAKRKYKAFPSAYACVPESSSKALTREGWKTVEEISIGEEILTFNIQKDELEFKPILNIHRYKDTPTQIVRSGNNGFIFESTSNHKWVVKLPETVSERKNKYNRINDMALIETSDLLENKNNKLLVVSAPYKNENNIIKNKIYKYGDNWIKYLLEASSAQRQAWLFSAIVYDGNQQKVERLTENKQEKEELEWKYDGKNDKQTFGFKQKDIMHRDAFLLSAFLNEGLVTWKKANNKEIYSCHYSSNKRYKNAANLKVVSENTTDVWCPETENNTWVMMQETNGQGIITITGNSGAIVKCRQGKIWKGQK